MRRLYRFLIIATITFITFKFILTGPESHIYPDTDEAPTLEFISASPGIDLDKIIRLGPYGVWEGWEETEDGRLYEPANEMQFYVESEKLPVYAVAPGIVGLVERNYEHQSGFITVLYGSDYSVVYHHLVDIPENIKSGKQIELGDQVGSTEIKRYTVDGNLITEAWWAQYTNSTETLTEAWWEIALNTKRDGVYRTLPPYEYFSEESKAILDSILEAAWTKGVDETSWTVRTGCSWIQYVGDEWPTSPSRLGDFGFKTSDSKEFLAKVGWKEGNEKGMVLGPTDECGRFGPDDEFMEPLMN